HLWDKGVAFMDNHPGQIAAQANQNVWPLAEGMFESLSLNDYLQIQQGMKPSGKGKHKGIHWVAIGASAPSNQPGHCNKGNGAQRAKCRIKAMKTHRGGPALQSKRTASEYADRLVFGIKNLPQDALGTITVSCGSIQKICQVREEAVNDMLIDMAPAARDLMSYYKGGNSGAMPATNAVSVAVGDYRQVVGQAVDAEITAAQSQLSQQLKSFTAQAKSQGWLSAGMWYWHMGRIQQALADKVNATPVYKQFDAQALKPVVDANLKGYTTAAARYAYLGRDLVDQESGDVSSNNGALGTFDKFINHYVGFKALNFFTNHLSGNNPLLSLQDWGNYILDANDGIIGAYFAYQYGSSLVSKIPVIGEKISALLGHKAVQAVSPLLWFVVFSLLGIGATFAFYLPALPFIIFTFAALGWIILCVESVVAGPMWAFAHSMPEGEGWAGTHARQGYMLFLNVLLRPALLIFGYFLSFFVLSAFAWFVAQSFDVLFKAITGANLVGVFSLLFMLYIITFVMIAVATKTFGLMPHLGERTLGWIGQLGHRFGEEQRAQQSHNAALVGVGRTQRGMEGGRKRLGSARRGGNPDTGGDAGVGGGGSGRGPSGGGGGGSGAQAAYQDAGLGDAPRGQNPTTGRATLQDALNEVNDPDKTKALGDYGDREAHKFTE
ncbi:MAG TPA: DotA/TraY family protein, partial [Gammaproteobacteria bacterium]|nr:DotA/TraY family protein [Gammaproteobacteria bacterium]